MSESAAPSGSSRCVSEVDLPSDKSRVEQQDYPFAAQQENTISKQLKTARKEQSDAKPPPQDEWLPAETITRRLKLYRAALNGDCAVAKDIYEKNEGEIGDEITRLGDTALHVAAQANCIDFVKELLKMMSTDDLAKKNKIGCTAFFYAAASGMVEIVEEMMKGYKDIAMVPDIDGTLPIVRAAALGQGQMVGLVYEQTKDSLTDDDCIELLVQLIETGLYVVALQLLRDRPRLATKRAKNEETALHILARKDLTSTNQNPRGTFFKRCFNLGAEKEENKPALVLVERLWTQVLLSSESYSKISELIKRPTRLIFDAANHGNVQFLSILIREYPDLMWKCDENGYTIFHIAVSNRLEELFKFIYDLKSIADLMVDSNDRKGNNILHLAGKLAPSNRLNVVSESALQMQRELLWFQAVKKVVPPRLAEAKNNNGLTPWDLFINEHEELKKEGETWVKDNASSCMIVATLIVALVFGAAITVPGGYKEDIGLPFFRHKTSFKVFAVSNVISLVFSSVSMVKLVFSTKKGKQQLNTSGSPSCSMDQI